MHLFRMPSLLLSGLDLLDKFVCNQLVYDVSSELLIESDT
jgi:hypothetical protein